MEEYWRMCMGISDTQNLSHRKSMENIGLSMNNAALFMAENQDFDADDFSDVFGGPPRSVLCRKFSCDFTEWASFYDEAFRPMESNSSYSTKGGRSLPSFKIPARGEGFYSDVFRSDDDLRRSSCERLSSDPPSVRSWGKQSPLRPSAGDEIRMSSFAPKFRWNSTTMVEDQEQIPPFPSNVSFNNENLHMENENHIENLMRRSSPYYGFCKHASSPEIISLDPSFRSIKISADELELNSPSSPASCFHQEPETGPKVQSNPIPEYEDDDGDEVMSSYVIEINSDFRRSSSEAISIDDAIAWAKESYNTPKSDQSEHEKDQTIGTEAISKAHESINQQMDAPGPMQSPLIKDEDVKQWSSGNENNIRMLLSTLHNILWPNSGWNMIDLTSLGESTQVKKAYQKARLCLHPDKLQQRGATLSQKHVAEKAFSILQDAWGAFMSQDVFFNQMTMQGNLESFWESWNKQGVQGFEGLRTVLKT